MSKILLAILASVTLWLAFIVAILAMTGCTKREDVVYYPTDEIPKYTMHEDRK
jgi:hypothetical protein